MDVPTVTRIADTRGMNEGHATVDGGAILPTFRLRTRLDSSRRSQGSLESVAPTTKKARLHAVLDSKWRSKEDPSLSCDLRWLGFRMQIDRSFSVSRSLVAREGDISRHRMRAGSATYGHWLGVQGLGSRNASILCGVLESALPSKD
jgi:hypothetical protein